MRLPHECWNGLTRMVEVLRVTESPADVFGEECGRGFMEHVRKMAEQKFEKVAVPVGERVILPFTKGREGDTFTLVALYRDLDGRLYRQLWGLQWVWSNWEEATYVKWCEDYPPEGIDEDAM